MRISQKISSLIARINNERELNIVQIGDTPNHNKRTKACLVGNFSFFNGISSRNIAVSMDHYTLQTQADVWLQRVEGLEDCDRNRKKRADHARANFW